MDKKEKENNKNNFNLRCENFKQELINNINESGLPISSIYYIYQLVFKELEMTYYATLNSETEEYKEEETLEGDLVNE
jgi:hypothetical protein